MSDGATCCAVHAPRRPSMASMGQPINEMSLSGGLRPPASTLGEQLTILDSLTKRLSDVHERLANFVNAIGGSDPTDMSGPAPIPNGIGVVPTMSAQLDAAHRLTSNIESQLDRFARVLG